MSKKSLQKLLIFVLFLSACSCVPVQSTVYSPPQDHRDGGHEHERDRHGEYRGEGRVLTDGETGRGRSVVIIYSANRDSQHLDRTFKKLAERYGHTELRFVNTEIDQVDHLVRTQMRDTPAFVFYENGRYSHTVEGPQDSYAILKNVQDYLQQ